MVDAPFSPICPVAWRSPVPIAASGGRPGVTFEACRQWGEGIVAAMIHGLTQARTLAFRWGQHR